MQDLAVLRNDLRLAQDNVGFVIRTVCNQIGCRDCGEPCKMLNAMRDESTIKKTLDDATEKI